MSIRTLAYTVAAVAFALGMSMLRDTTAQTSSLAPVGALDLFGSSRPVLLTGKDADGRISAPVISLWRRPGLDRANTIVARVPLPVDGTLHATLTDTFRLGDETWYEVSVSGAQGWVVDKFVTGVAGER